MNWGVGELVIQIKDRISNLNEKLKFELNKNDGEINVQELQNNIQNMECEMENITEKMLMKLSTDYTINSLNSKHKLFPHCPYTSNVDYSNNEKYIGKLYKQLKSYKSSRMLLDKQMVTSQRFISDDLLKKYNKNFSPGEYMKQKHQNKMIANVDNKVGQEITQKLLVSPKESFTRQDYRKNLDKMHSFNNNVSNVPSTSNDKLNKNFAQIINANDLSITLPVSTITFSPSPLKLSSIKLKNKKTTFLIADESIKEKDTLVDIKNNKKCKYRQPIIYLKKASTSIIPLNYEYSSSNNSTPPPTTPASVSELLNRNNCLIYEHGNFKKDDTYKQFQKNSTGVWGSIITLFKQYEKLYKAYNVNIAYMNPKILKNIAMKHEQITPTVDILTKAIINYGQIYEIINQKGQLYRGFGGLDIAASKIQSTWRMYKDRKQYLEYRKHKWTSGVIAISWILNLRYRVMKKKLKARQRTQYEHYTSRFKVFQKNWKEINSNKRVIIHLPSLGFSSEIRNNIKSIGIIQNFQIGRICDIMDPNVEVIYISPVSLNAEVEEYYKKFILLDNYYRHNTTENFENIPKDFELDQLNFKTENGALSRFKIIVPDYINSFPNHNLSLSTLLKYSSQSMRQLKTLILNKKAYIVNSYTSFDDIIIANELKISIFGCDPYVHQFLHNKTNTKKIFIELKLDLPPNDIDILNIDQLYESLAQLMIENLHVEKWALKINNSFNSDGILLVNVTKMESYLFVLKEYNRYQERWNNKWAQEASFTKLVTELVYFISKNGQQIKPVYKSAKHFISKFLEHGGIIEAIVPSESYICCTVVVEISPDLSTKILVTADQIHSSHQSMVAETYSIPQTSINPEKLNKYTYLIVQKCIDHNVIGYVNIDFVTFYDTKDNQEITWVLDFSIRYDKLLSILKISNYFTRAEYNEINHSYQIEKEKINIVQPKSQKKSKLYQSRNCIDPRPNCRSVIASNQLFHSNLSVIQYGVFFQMCRANTIGYDINQRIGTSFAIVDAKYRQYLGMITVSDNIVDALKKYIKNLVIIHQEISSKTMQGSNNFMTLKNSLEKMLKLAEKNFEIAKDAI